MSNEKVYIPTEAIVEVSLGAKSESTLAKSCANNDGLPKLTVEDVENGYLTLKDALKALGFAHLMYVRRLVRKGDLEGIKVVVSNTPRWLVTRESVEAYQTKQIRRGSARNYTLRIDPEHEAKLRSLLKANDIEYELDLAYEPKKKSTTKAEAPWAKVIKNLEG